jgi:hypothetical protein
MEKTTEKLIIQNIDGQKETATILHYREETTRELWVLKFISSIFQNKYKGTDIFQCLISLRRELAEHNYFPLCNGARIDTYPSGMCGSMGNGFVVLQHRLGKQTSINDILHTFDYAEPDLIGSVEEQLEFLQQCLNSDGEPEVLKIQYADGTIIEGSLFVYLGANPTRIKFTSSVTPDLECINIDYFQCLITLREQLAQLKYRPLCNGARLDAYVLPSSLREMRGWMVTIISELKIPTYDDELRIFDEAEPVSIASIQEQKEYYESWLNSVRYIPISDYGNYGISCLPELYFRLMKIGDLPLMWLFDIQLELFSDLLHQNIQTSENSDEFEDDDESEILQALSPLSPEQVEQIGSLSGEAILGFITGYIVSLDYFTPNQVFKDFIQKVIATEAPKDSELQAAALEQQAGRLYIIDNRVTENQQPETALEDILGVFEILDGQIVPNSYQPNENYLVFGNNGLFQLPGTLHDALISALLALPPSAK